MGLICTLLFERLGILEAIKPKVIRPETDIVSELVAKGEIELGMVVITQIMTTPGVELVGLIGGSDACGFNSERVSANFANCHAGFWFDIIADVVLPNIRLVSLHLLRYDVFTLECFVGPKMIAPSRGTL